MIINDSWEEIYDSFYDGSYYLKYHVGDEKFVDLTKDLILEPACFYHSWPIAFTCFAFWCKVIKVYSPEDCQHHMDWAADGYYVTQSFPQYGKGENSGATGWQHNALREQMRVEMLQEHDWPDFRSHGRSRVLNKLEKQLTEERGELTWDIKRHAVSASNSYAD